ncbi:2-polyprenyl-6-methoxyphenol hydroxylase-like FAD-dependent oxidoreductase [Amycolatopsis lexingtonensis]|uniref:Flavin-dependent monooxygenase n=1 Tax=Amycolatopsis lexingtonensis TaxID=218822 RepID=A0ABR9IH09_9PSEU|nr:NAD(P)/FAD-dependent oxidoreductase [Amycolatopsis lexingtonensis]MBE1502454.1 2-polyprenyl-6-methoxyphenol hydroxylase-like FAD-dependent oxidoreductase [Amycolatopsis lexingtonensis]
MPARKIAIVGAGLSGLVCARILQRNGMPVTVYEADATPDARQQGGSLDIHEDTGQIALKEAGLYDEFSARTHVGGEDLRLLDKTGRVHVDRREPDGGDGRPEIDRTELRQLLVESLEPGTIVWGRKVLGARPVTAGHELQLADGSVVRADLVVGADGAWSRIRPLLTPAKPRYTGITVVELRLTDAVAKHPEALALTGRGSFFALSDDKYIGGHGGNTIAYGCGLRVPENWVTDSGIDWHEPESARAGLLREYPGWAPSLTGLIRECDDDAIWPRPIHALPIGLRWERVPGVTLAGDAAHVMSPFAGEGANIALIDGADLAREILGGADVETALTRYENTMFPRAAEAAAASQQGLDMMFVDGPPTEMIAFFTDEK